MFFKRRAGKKKSLTDPVSIIPFPDHGLRKKDSSQKKSIPLSKPQIEKVNRPVPKTLSTPSGHLHTSSLSIKKMMEKKNVSEQKVDLSQMPVNDYNLDDLKMAWRQYAFEMKTEGKETFYNALIKRDPVRKSDDKFLLEVDNQVQIDYIRPIITELNDYIRKKLKNYAILIEVEITKNPDDEIKFMTGKDKFIAMARKNPNLHTLKNIFGLDIEF